MEAVNYRRVMKGEAGFERIETLRYMNIWVCDSYDHNEDNGCSNPDCFKNERWKNKEWNPPHKIGQ